MSSIENAQDNPILVFGDVDPDILKLSQVYDPDNDKYVKSLDDEYTYDETKQYWKRTVSYNRIIFEKISLSGKLGPYNNPSFNDWYEENAMHKSQAGTYVPAVGSVVVVNERTDDYKEYTLLAVAAVDNETEYKEYEDRTSLPAASSSWDGKIVHVTSGSNKDKYFLCLKVSDSSYGWKETDPVIYPTYKSTLVPVNFGTGAEISARSLDYGNDAMYLYIQEITDEDGVKRIRFCPDRKLMLYGQRYYMYRIIKNNTPIATKTWRGADILIPYASAASTEVTVTADNYDSLVGCYFDLVSAAGITKVLIGRSYWLTNDGTYNATSTYFKKLSGGWEKLEFCDDPTINRFFCKTEDKVASEIGKVYWYNNTLGWHPIRVVASGGNDITTINVGTDFTRSSTVFFDDFPVGTEIVHERYQHADLEGLLGKTGYVHNDSRSTLENVYVPTLSWLRSGQTIADGEVVRFEVYEFGNEAYDHIIVNEDGRVPEGMEIPEETSYAFSMRLVMNVQLQVRVATALSPADFKTKWVTKFDVFNYDQSIKPITEDDDTWYLLDTESAADLNIEARLTFNDGSIEVVPVDNRVCFGYGLDRIPKDASDESTIRKRNMIIGREYPLLFKYFPANAYSQQWAKIINRVDPAFVSCRKTLKIVSSAADTIRKISIVPVWDFTNSVYRLYYLVYNTAFEEPAIVEGKSTTPIAIDMFDITILVGSVETPISYDRAIGLFEKVMHGKISMTAKFQGYKTAVYTQPIAFKFSNWADSAAGTEKFLIGPDTSTWDETKIPYGSDVNNNIRPYIVYNDVNPAAIEWSIPLTVFSSKITFMNNFWFNGIAGIKGTAGVEPTHFRVRAISQNVASAFQPISLGGNETAYANPFVLNATHNASEHVGGAVPVLVGEATRVMGTVIVEFVTEMSDGTYRYLYGVPVETRRYNW